MSAAERIAALEAQVAGLITVAGHLCARLTNVEMNLRMRKLSSTQTDRDMVEYPYQFSPGAYDQIVALVRSQILESACPPTAPIPPDTEK